MSNLIFLYFFPSIFIYLNPQPSDFKFCNLPLLNQDFEFASVNTPGVAERGTRLQGVGKNTND